MAFIYIIIGQYVTWTGIIALKNCEEESVYCVFLINEDNK